MFLKIILQYLIFLCGKVIETMTVHGNGSSKVLFWCAETNACINFRGKSFLCSHFLFECFDC